MVPVKVKGRLQAVKEQPTCGWISRYPATRAATAFWVRRTWDSLERGGCCRGYVLMVAVKVKGRLLAVNEQHTCDWICRHPATDSPGEIKSWEVELGCHSWMVCLAAELFLNSCFSDTVFVTFAPQSC